MWFSLDLPGKQHASTLKFKSDRAGMQAECRADTQLLWKHPESLWAFLLCIQYIPVLSDISCGEMNCLSTLQHLTSHFRHKEVNSGYQW